jgi:hypothetical protein
MVPMAGVERGSSLPRPTSGFPLAPLLHQNFVEVATDHFCNLNTNMAGTKEKKHTSSAKRELDGDERPAKKAKLLDNTDDEDSDSDNDGGVALKINDEYATRYEHNKKRAERQKCMYTRCVYSDDS